MLWMVICLFLLWWRYNVTNYVRKINNALATMLVDPIEINGGELIKISRFVLP
jgi:hypothetical protein